MALITYPEPTWTTSQDAVPPMSRLRTLLPTPLILTGVIMNLMRLHFADTDNLENALLTPLQWHPDARQTRIYIDASENQRLDVVESVPSVYVKRADVTVERIGIGKDDVSVSGSSSRPLYQKKLDGIFRIEIESRVKLEAEMLAIEIFMRMLRFAPVIREDIGLGLFQVRSLSEVRAFSKGANATVFRAQVSLGWAHTARWSIVADAPMIKRLSFTANLV